MTDVFASEILSLIILVPVIFRPFSRRLQRMDGIPLLSAVSFLLIVFSTVAFGLPFSLLPAFLCSFTFFMASAPRLARLAFSLPTDWYGLPSRVLYTVLSLVWVAAFASSIIFSGEPPLVPGENVSHRKESVRVGPGERGSFLEWAPIGASARLPRGLVLFIGDIASGPDGRQTAAYTLAKEGFAVMSVDLRLPFARGTAGIALPQARRFFALMGRILSGSEFVLTENLRSSVHRSEFHRLLGEAERRYPSAFSAASDTASPTLPLFVLLEGSSVSSVLDAVSLGRLPTTGIACLVSGEESGTDVTRISRRDPPWFVARVREADSMPNGVEGVDILLVTSAADGLFGFGEVACDDVLAARLLGGTRDAGRIRAERVGRRIASWCILRTEANRAASGAARVANDGASR